jgi:hypothetical protein
MTTASSTPPACSRCDRRGRETYDYLCKEYLFDVDRARALVADGREPVELEEESVRDSVRYSRICKEHINHVDPSEPGIIAHLFYRTEDGERIHAHLLIDGNHRAARSLRDGRPYHAYLLSEEESQDILLRSPEGPGPVAKPARACSAPAC